MISLKTETIGADPSGPEFVRATRRSISLSRSGRYAGVAPFSVPIFCARAARRWISSASSSSRRSISPRSFWMTLTRRFYATVRSGLLFWRVPDRRGVGPLRDGHGGARRRLVAESFRIVRGPARRRDLDHPAVVEGGQGRIELRVAPDRVQLGGADRIGPGRIRHVYGTADRGHLPGLRIGLALARPGDVVDLLLQRAALVEPALDDLVAIEVRADRVLERGDEEGRCLALRRIGKVAAHGHALRVANLRRQAVVRVAGFEVPAAEKAHDHARASGRIGLLALHRIPQGRACVFFGPDGGVARSTNFPVHDLHAGLGILDKGGTQPMRAGFLWRGLAEKVVLLHRREARMRVAAADQAELVRVCPELLLHLEPVLECRARVFELEHLLLLSDATVEVALVPELKVGELVVRRQERVGFTGALGLR